MSSYIYENKKALSQSHYIRKAGARDYWFDFTNSRLEQYRSRLGSNFCMIIYGSEQFDDTYIMPYGEVASLFTENLLDDRGRWIGYIKNDVIHLSPGNRAMSVSAYYNAFELLFTEIESDGGDRLAEPSVFYGVGDTIDKMELRRKIQEYNEKYRQTIPHRRRVIAEQIARPGAITDYLKKLHGYTCQICGEQGFLRRNGVPYIEAHHINELHKLIPGSYCSDNIVVVCAACHKKLHYAEVNYSPLDELNVAIYINGTEFRFTRNVLSSE